MLSPCTGGGTATAAPFCRYNHLCMIGLMYAAVTYVRSPAGMFVEEMRRDLHPAHTHADAHITVLPPRPLQGTEADAIRQLREICRSVTPFEVTMGDVESFVPTTPTVFIRVAYGAYRIRELHDHLNQGPLLYCEPWPYMPHLTIVKLDTIDEARKVICLARPRWDQMRRQSQDSNRLSDFCQGKRRALDGSGDYPAWRAERKAGTVICGRKLNRSRKAERNFGVGEGIRTLDSRSHSPEFYH